MTSSDSHVTDKEARTLMLIRCLKFSFHTDFRVNMNCHSFFLPCPGMSIEMTYPALLLDFVVYNISPGIPYVWLQYQMRTRRSFSRQVFPWRNCNLIQIQECSNWPQCWAWWTMSMFLSQWLLVNEEVLSLCIRLLMPLFRGVFQLFALFCSLGVPYPPFSLLLLL